MKTHFINSLTSTGCYEEIGRSINSGFEDDDLHFKEFHHMLRIVPHKRCRDRMIKRGYYKNNKSLTLRNDFERSF